MNDQLSSEEEFEHRLNPVPSLFTLCNALCGFTSILFTMNAGNGPIPVISLWLVGFAMLFDVLDGLAARLLNAQSVHGMNLDSLADAISFGAAPAVIIYRLVLGDASGVGHIHSLAWLAAACYLGCELWRLAHYNSIKMEETDDHGDFVGLPSPAAAAMICCMAILVPALAPGVKTATTAYVSYALLSAGLMVSTVPYTHVRRSLTNKRGWVSIVFLVGVIASFVVFRIWALVAWAHFYVLYAPVIEMEARIARHADKHATTL